MTEFKILDIDDKNLFEKYTKNKYENSETSFSNLYIWRDYFDTRFAEICGFLVVLYTSPDGRINSYAPYGSGNLFECIELLCKYFEDNGQKLRIVSASENTANKIKSMYPSVTVTENIDFNDYVYLSKSLIELSEKKLHSKKNHLNKFKNTYDYVYRKMKKDDFGQCINLASRLMLKNREASSLSYRAELKSLENAFKNFDYFEYSGGVIEIDGKIEAFSVGERLTDDMALIHIEKANTSYSGIYAAINNEFVKNEWSGVKYINREEDMGLEGLRKAKTSYRPDHMVRKYICEFN